jgi:hypothetical protein
MILDVHFGSGTRIRIVFLYPESWIQIPDLEVKIAPDPGSVSATLPGSCLENNHHVRSTCCREKKTMDGWSYNVQ